MKAHLAVAAAFLAVAIGCSSMKVNHDWDRQADFSSYKTYAWHDSDTNVKDTDPLAHERFISAIDYPVNGCHLWLQCDVFSFLLEHFECTPPDTSIHVVELQQMWHQLRTKLFTAFNGQQRW